RRANAISRPRQCACHMDTIRPITEYSCVLGSTRQGLRRHGGARTRGPALLPFHARDLSRRAGPDDAAMTALLQVKGLTKRCGKLMALHDVSFDVGHGEIVGLIGPNGAGKTTLIGLLSGEIAASAGSVLFCGQSILGLRPYRIGELGIVRSFQLVQPFLHLTVRECVMLGALFGASANR